MCGLAELRSAFGNAEDVEKYGKHMGFPRKTWKTHGFPKENDEHDGTLPRVVHFSVRLQERHEVFLIDNEV